MRQCYPHYKFWFFTEIEHGTNNAPLQTVSDLTTELKGALVDLGHKSAFDLLLKEAWNPEIAAMGNSTLPIVLDKLNVTSGISLLLWFERMVKELQERIGELEDRLNEMKPKADVTV